MTYRDNGASFCVSYTAYDSQCFHERWPGSTVAGTGWFMFAATTGDLDDVGGTARFANGPDWLAFMDDCRTYGNQQRRILQEAGCAPGS